MKDHNENFGQLNKLFSADSWFEVKVWRWDGVERVSAIVPRTAEGL